MALNINELSFENIGAWPRATKIAAIGAVCLALMILFFWFDSRQQMTELERLSKQEGDVRQEFELKYHMASNLDLYNAQLQEIKKRFGLMLKQLPSVSEVPHLLEDISKNGVASGLEFKSFLPLPEENHDFYAQLPIKISVTGNYHQLAQFVNRIASLDRIVTLHDFEIYYPNATGQNKTTDKTDPQDLLMDITAKTYRYVETPVVNS